MTSETRAPRSFTLDGGGPFQYLMHRLHLVTPGGKVRSVRLALFAWLPIMIAAGLRAMTHRTMDPTLFDLSQHTRILIAVPAILLAQRLVGLASSSAIHSLYRGNL